MISFIYFFHSKYNNFIFKINNKIYCLLFYNVVLLAIDYITKAINL